METSELFCTAIELRAGELPGRDLWFCVEDTAEPEAHALHEAGMLDRRQHGDDAVWRLSDQALRKVEAAVARSGAMN